MAEVHFTNLLIVAAVGFSAPLILGLAAGTAPSPTLESSSRPNQAIGRPFRPLDAKYPWIEW